MDLKDYLLQHKPNENEYSLIQSSLSELEKAQMNCFIIGFLNLKNELQTIIKDCKIDGLKINLLTKYHEESATWHLRCSASKPLPKTKEEPKNTWYTGGDEDSADYYSAPSNTDWLRWTGIEGASYKRASQNKTPDINPYQAEEIKNINSILGLAASHISSKNHDWFGDIKKEYIHINLPTSDLSKLEEQILGDEPKMLLNKTLLDIELPEKSNDDEIPRKKLKI